MNALQQALQNVSNFLGKKVTGAVNQTAVALGGPSFSNWSSDLVNDTKKRGIAQGVQDLFNPIGNNQYVYPVAEPIVSAARVGNYKIGQALQNAVNMAQQVFQGRQFIMPLISQGLSRAVSPTLPYFSNDMPIPNDRNVMPNFSPTFESQSSANPVVRMTYPPPSPALQQVRQATLNLPYLNPLAKQYFSNMQVGYWPNNEPGVYDVPSYTNMNGQDVIVNPQIPARFDYPSTREEAYQSISPRVLLHEYLHNVPFASGFQNTGNWNQQTAGRGKMVPTPAYMNFANQARSVPSYGVSDIPDKDLAEIYPILGENLQRNVLNTPLGKYFQGVFK